MLERKDIMTLPDADSLSTYGGQFENYLVDVVDPVTDLSADQFNQLSATVAMGSRMLPRCVVQFLGHGTTPTLVGFEAQWKGTTVTAPTIAHSSTGVYTVTFGASVQDELLVSHTLNLVYGWGQAEGGAVAYVVSVTPVANVITFHVFLASTAALNDAVGIALTCWAR